MQITKRTCTQLCFPLLWLLVHAGAAGENSPAYFSADTIFNDDIPTPAFSLGFEVGEWHARHDQIVAYMHAVAEASPRVMVQTIGNSYEERPLLHLTISSPKNLARLDVLREAHRKFTTSGTTGSETGDLPVFVWLNYSIHGNEASGANAAMLVAYYLAAADASQVGDLLDNLVIVLDPTLNPDGLSLYTTWVNSHKSKTLIAHPLHREHTTIWPHGRMNHYWFNLNRDWLFVQQQESQAVNRQFYDWLPHVVADFHETGSDTTAYFQPGVQTRVHPLTTDANIELTKQFGQFSATAYDKAGLLYYTKERFDDFYHGKSSTFADLAGAIGLTFEVGSSRGHLKDSVNGKVDFPLTIKKQIIQSLATLRGAYQLRDELLTYQRDYFESAIREASNDDVQGYVVSDDGDPGRLKAFSELLLRHQVEVYGLSKDIVQANVTFTPDHSLFIPTSQRQYRLVKSLFERRTEFEDPVFYDISTWNAPLAFNLPYQALRNVRGVRGGQFDTQTDYATKVIESEFAYAFSWADYWAPKALSLLLKENVNVRVATHPFTIATHTGEQVFDRGSIVIPVRMQKGLTRSLFNIVQEAATASGVQIQSIPGGLAVAGIDVGSRSMHRIYPMRPMLLVGEGISRSDAGEVWHLLDWRFDIELPLIELSRLENVKLSEFTHIIMVDGDYSMLDRAMIKKMRDWVDQGGTMITQRDATSWAGDNGFFVIDESLTADATELEANPSGLASDNGPRFDQYSNQEHVMGQKRIAGAIFRIDIDSSHPIGFGYKRGSAAVMRRGTETLPSLPNRFSHVARYSSKPRLSGYASQDNIDAIANTPAVVAIKIGEGTVIAFADNPNFRGYFFGTNRLFLNGLFFSQAIDYAD